MMQLVDILAAGVADDSGRLLDSGRVTVYRAGTATKVIPYSDYEGTTPLSNPLTLDEVGRADVWVDGRVKLVIVDQDGGSVRTIDDVNLSDQDVIGAVEDANSFRGWVSVADHGAIGDGSTDDSAAISTALLTAESQDRVLYGVPGKVYLLRSDVNFRDVAVDFSGASIVVTNGARVILGGTASLSQNPRQDFKSITRSGGATSTSSARVMGAKGQIITIDECDYLDLYADTSTGDSGPDYSIAYSTFHLNKCDKLVLTNNASTSGSSVQWINENTFFLNRVTTLTIEGTYAHNHNHFHRGTFESATITISKGSYNMFWSPRFEGSCTVTCASGTFDNMFLAGWASNENVEGFDTNPATFTDNSGQNFCTWIHRAFQRRIPIVTVNPHNCETYSAVVGAARNNYTSIKGVDVGAYGIDQFGQMKFVRSNFAIVYDCPLIPVSKGDIITFNGDATVFRYRIKLYNSAGVQLTESSDADIANYLVCSSGLAWDNTNDNFQQSANSSETIAHVRSSAFSFLKFDIESGSSVSSTPFTRFALQLITKNPAASASYKSLGTMYETPAVSSSPTVGFCPQVGRKVSNTAGGWFTCTFVLSTTLSGAEASGQTTLSMTSITGIASGDIVGIYLDSGATHWTTVNGSPSGGTIVVTDALPSDAASGNRVVINRWTNT